jgi:hypothetical protein
MIPRFHRVVGENLDGEKITLAVNRPRAWQPSSQHRIRSLNEEKTEKLSFEELIAYWNIMHKIDPRLVRHAFEEAFIDRGLTNSEVLRLL